MYPLYAIIDELEIIEAECETCLFERRGYFCMKRSNPKQSFDTVEDLYRHQMNHFVSLASRHVYNRDLAIDMVHDAFSKAVTYFNKNPHRRVRPQIVEWLVLKACKKANKYSKELPAGDTREFFQE